MARDFDGSADYLFWDAAHLTVSNQMSVALWLNKDGGTSDRAAMYNNTHGWMISVNGDSQVSVHFLGGTGAANYGVDNTKRLKALAANSVWHNVCGTVSSGTDKTVESAYLNGVAMTDTTGGSWGDGTINDRIYVGARSDATGHFNGRVAEVAVWESYQLTAEDAAALAAGISPLRIQPDNLVHYAPLTGEGSGERDRISGKAATHNSAPPQAEHPMIILPPPSAMTREAPAAGGPLTIPVAMNHYRRHHLGAMH